MRNSLSRVQFSAFGAAAVLLGVMMLVNRGRAPASASASEMSPGQTTLSIEKPATQPTAVSDAGR
ncbi:MAG TPA: hypothetical protein VLI90_01045 [Tepidisphaeraceae bacterium]|nr:hypothetical protein [Tepidisphaeraceae bacterium]